MTPTSPATAVRRPATAPPRTGTRPDTRWLDVLRIVAVVGVVCIHAVGSVTKRSGTGWHPAGWWAADLLNSACLWVVPVFVMASGALLLDPARAQSAGEFYRRRLARVGPALICWTGVYLWWRSWFGHEQISLHSAVHDIAQGTPYLQLYFLFVILGLYAITPVLRRLLTVLGERETLWLTAGALGFGLIEYTVRGLGGAGSFDAVTRFLPFVGYYLAGHVLFRMRLPALAVRLAPWVAVASWLATALGSAALSAHYGWNHVGFYFYDYLSPTVIVFSLAIFVVARTRAAALTDRAGWLTASRLRRAGAATFGVFLIHPLLLFPVMRALDLPDPDRLGRTVAWAVPLAVGVSLAAGVVTVLVGRVPLLRRLVL